MKRTFMKICFVLIHSLDKYDVIRKCIRVCIVCVMSVLNGYEELNINTKYLL